MIVEDENDDSDLGDDSVTISYLRGEPYKEAEEIWINAKLSSLQEFALKFDEKVPEEGNIPPEYHEYLDVFDEKTADRFPKSRVWDHKIEMKPGFEPKAFSAYKLTPEECKQQELFVRENLKKGYIRPSKSPMASPFFFISKKDGRYRPTQDYRYLNKWTIKNAYPLPIIGEIMDVIKASGARFFTSAWKSGPVRFFVYI